MESETVFIGRIPDESDRASLIEAAFTEESIEMARKAIAPETHPEFDGIHCVECGEEIPDVRLRLGKVRCVECQREIEWRHKLFRV